VASTFGEVLRSLRETRGLSHRRLAALAHVDPSYLSHLERGRRVPSPTTAQNLDAALDAGGALAALAPRPLGPDDAEPWATAELVHRLRRSDVSAETLDSLTATVERLIGEYAPRPAAELRAETRQWLDYICRLLHEPTSLRAHRELLVSGGWLALLIGCLEMDLGMRPAGETTRVAALRLGDEAGHTEIVAWAHEMHAWVALAGGDTHGALTAARAGQDVSRGSRATVQLINQEAKALARIGDVDGVRETLDRGTRLVEHLGEPDRPNHFRPNGAKFRFHAMDAARIVGDDELAAAEARRVLDMAGAPPGARRSAMRDAEARMTLGVVAARAEDLDEAVSHGAEALSGSNGRRRSKPSLLLCGKELIAELERRWPSEPRVREYRALLRDAASA
jgi:transcriptional regulator with XRE-family HTH domain